MPKSPSPKKPVAKTTTDNKGSSIFNGATFTHNGTTFTHAGHSVGEYIREYTQDIKQPTHTVDSLDDYLRAVGQCTHTGDPRFHSWLERMGELHDSKQGDYGQEHDPFANIRAAAGFGVEPWVGALVRANDKMARLQKAASGKTLNHESVLDSLIDLANYAIIAAVLYEEANPQGSPE